MSQPTWQFWMVDAAGNTLADLSLLQDPNYSTTRVGSSVLQGKLPLTSDAAAAIPEGGAYIKAYRIKPGGSDSDRVLRFYGSLEIDEVEGSNATDSMMVTAYSPDAILENRITTATYSSATQRGTILQGVIDTANTDNDTGIRTNSINIEATTATTVDFSQDKPTIASVFSQFAEALDGCDAEFRPIELASGKIADLYVYNQRGTTNTGVVFGYGADTIANCTQMRRVRNRRNLENYVEGFSAAVTVTAQETSSINTNRKRYGSVSLTNEASTLEAQARVLGRLASQSTASALAEYTVTTGPDAPRLWDDFNIGDTVTLDFRKGSIAFSVTQRVEAVTVQIDNNGVETISQLAFRSPTT